MTKTAIVTGVLLLLVVAQPVAAGRNPSPARIRVSWFSQQDGNSKAVTGAGITVQTQQPGRPVEKTRPTAAAGVHAHGSGTSPKAIGGAVDPLPWQPPYPPLAANTPRLQLAQPYGPGSFWYQDTSGHVCEYIPKSTGICFTLTGTGGGAPASPALTPAVIAESTADRMTLSTGELKASPTGVGLTGAASWFWLDPAPTTQELSVSIAGEAVTVTAVPQVSWRFGDGTTLNGGPGVPYRPGPVSGDAVTHTYDTRCLPGDQGHDPYVLASCGSRGYQLIAAVSWEITYQAHGSVASTGVLPTRTTSSAAGYPVSEARAFLTGGAN